jgi:peptidylprolyl isomerase
MVHLSTTLLLGMACSSTQAWTTAPAVKKSLSTASTTRTSLQAVSRQDFLKTAFAATAATTLTAVVTASPLAAFAAEPIALPNGVTYTVTKKGEGPLPDRGELCAIRFSSGFGDVKIDDIFETPEPYYTRVGSGGLIKGVEETLPLMRVGDRWVLTIPVSLKSDQVLAGLN